MRIINKTFSRNLLLSALWVIPVIIWPRTTDGSLTIKWAAAAALVPLLAAFNLNVFNKKTLKNDPVLTIAGILVLMNVLYILYKTGPSNLKQVTLYQYLLGVVLYLLFRLAKLPVKQFVFFQISAGTCVVVYGLMTRLGYHIGNWGVGKTLISTLGNPNFVAQYLLMFTPFIFAGFHFSRNKIIRAILFVILILTFIVFYLAFSTGGNIGLIGETIFYFFILFLFVRRKKTFVHKRVLFCVVLILTSAFLYISSRKEISVFFEGAQRFRTLSWQATVEMIREKPFIGHGSGTFKLVYPVYRYQKERVVSSFNRVSRPHSDPLHFMSDIGVIGWGLWILLLVVVYYKGLYYFNRSPYFISAALASITGTLLHGLVSMNLHNPAPLFVFFILSGQLLSIEPSPETAPFKSKKWIVSVFLFISALTGVQILAADLHTRQGNEHHNFALSHSKNNEREYGFRKSIEHLNKSNDILKHQFLNYYRLGLVYSSRGKYGDHASRKEDLKRSLNSYRMAVSEAPYYEDYRNNLGVDLRELGYNEKAFSSFISSIHINGNYDQAYANLALVFENAGNNELAKKMYNRAIQNNAEFADVYGNLATIYFNEKNFKEAETIYRKAIEINPNSAVQWTNIGIALERQKNWIEAEKSYNRAIELQPDYSKPRFGLSTVYIQTRSYKKALKVLTGFHINSNDPLFAMITKRQTDLKLFISGR